MAGRDEIVRYANELLEADRWPEFGPAGLQVIGAQEVEKVVSGVSASLELFERAAQSHAQLVLVHHGLFWRNEPLVVDRRLRARLEALFRADLSLVAYHLALDAHRELGNNAQLARRLGVEAADAFGALGLGGRLREPLPAAAFAARVADLLGREPLLLAHGPEPIERVAIVTGGGGYELVLAAHEGYDALLTGEPEEPNLHSARELGITLVAAGHHATERFGLVHEYLEVANPV